MAIKLSGDTIIDDNRVVVNADKIGIGTTNPQVALEIFSGDVGIGTTNPNASNIKTALDNNTNILAVGIVTANNLFGTFKGSIDNDVTLENAEKINIQTNSSAGSKYLTFVDSTSGYNDLYVHTGIKYNPDFYNNNGSSKLTIDGDVGIAGTLTYEDVTNVDSLGIITARKGLRAEEGGLIITAGITTLMDNVGIGTEEYDDPIGTQNNVKLAVAGIVTAYEYYGTFKGTVEPSPPITLDKIEEGNSSVEVVDPNSDNSAYIQIVVAGVEKQQILSSGQVNIKNIEGTGLNISGSNHAGMEVKVTNSSTAQNRDTFLKILNENDKTIAQQVGQVQSDGGSAWIWETQTSGARDTSRIEERLRITADGHVGIGTTNPIASNVETALDSNTKVLAVGIVTANEFYGTFKGTVDPSVGSLSDIDVKQFSNHTTTPKTERTCPNPIEVNISGIGATIGIGSTSNAYGRRYIQDTAPSIGVCEGDIWYDTSTTGGGSFTIDKIIEGNTKAEVVDTGSNGHFLVETENTERLRITSTGQLNLAGDMQFTAANPELEFNNGGPRFRVPSANTLAIHNGGGLGSTDNEAVRITGIGSVGIGTTNPDARLNVSNPTVLGGNVDDRQEIARFHGSVNPNKGILEFSNVRTANQTPSGWESSAFRIQRIIDVTRMGYIDFGTGAGSGAGGAGRDIQFGSGDGTMMMHLDSTGNVGIGTTVFNTPVLPSNNSILAVGIVTANKYYGDGSALTGITAGGGGGNVATSIQTFTSAGTFTYTPTSGTTSIIVHVIGGGGASGTPNSSSWSGGGGAGGVAIKTYNMTELGSSATVNVGDGSGYDTFPNANNGPDGGNSSFNPSGTGPTIIGYGGKGSNSSFGGGTGYSEGGDGGAAANGDINFTGEKGIVVKEGALAGSGVTTIVANYRTNANSSVSRYQIHRAKPAGGGYGQYGLGGEATFTSYIGYNNGRGGESGAVIIYEFAGGGSGSGGSGSGNSFVLLSEQTPTGNEVEFTGIPSDAMEITVMLNGVSHDGGQFSAQHFVVQLGTSSGYVNSGYVSNSNTVNEGSGVHGHASEAFTNGFGIYGGTGAVVLYGSMIINKASSNSYTEIGNFRTSATSGSVTRGSLSSVSGTIDRLKIKVTSSLNFDAGTISVSYKTSSSGGGANVNVGSTPPTSPSPIQGDLWWDSDNGDLHVYYTDVNNTSQWVSVNSGETIQKVSATGGTTSTVNGYKVHKFTTSGTFDVTASGEVEVLVVAGGGSEGGSTTSPGQPGCHGGGGGGGGGVVRKLIDVHAGSKYKVTIGAGGGWRSNGGNSSFAGEAQALGGGAGGATLVANGNGGGSGGGASRSSGANQGGASEQVNTYGYGMGNAGGNEGSTTAPGGGGGAGGPGSSGSATGTGDGGPGYDASDFEPNLYVGAGGNANGSTNSTAEGRTPNNTNGAANTGAGGGGSPGGTNPRYSGGSGVVFVRYIL